MAGSILQGSEMRKETIYFKTHQEAQSYYELMRRNPVACSVELPVERLDMWQVLLTVWTLD